MIAIVAAAGGILSLLGGASVLSGMASGSTILAVIVVIFGIFGLTLGAGFYTGAGWAWMAGIVIYVISIGLGVDEITSGISIGQIGGVIRIIAGVLIPVYLTRKGPRTFFGKSKASSSSAPSPS